MFSVTYGKECRSRLCALLNYCMENVDNASTAVCLRDLRILDGVAQSSEFCGNSVATRLHLKWT